MKVDVANAVRFDEVNESNIFFVAFACMQLYRPEPAYEWQRSFAAYPVNRLYARDMAQFYYLYGLEGAAADLHGSIEWMRDFIGRRSIDCSAYLGASTGGFAALMFGSLLGADEVHAFSPMTRMPSRRLVEILRLVPSQNWQLMRKSIELRYRVRYTRSLDRRYLDMRPLMQNDNGRTIYHIYYGRHHGPDRRAAERVADLPRVFLHAYDYDKHYLVGHLKETNQLAPILDGMYQRLSAAARPQPQHRVSLLENNEQPVI